MAVIESPNLIFLQSLADFSLEWGSFQCLPQPPPRGWAAFSFVSEPRPAILNVSNCSSSSSWVMEDENIEFQNTSSSIVSATPVAVPLLPSLSSCTLMIKGPTTTNQMSSRPLVSITSLLPPSGSSESTFVHPHEDVFDVTKNYRISASIRANCITSLVNNMCLFQPIESSGVMASNLVLVAKLRILSPDHTIDAPELRLLYHWSEANHHSLGLTDNDIEIMWLDIDWSDRVLQIPHDLISPLLLLQKSSSSSPLILNFRVWVRLFEATELESGSWSSGSALSSSFASIDVIIGGMPTSGSCEFAPIASSPPNPVIALETPVRVR